MIRDEKCEGCSVMATRLCGLFFFFWVSILFIFSFFRSHEAVALWDYLLTYCRVGYGWLAVYKRKHEALAEKTRNIRYDHTNASEYLHLFDSKPSMKSLHA